MFAKLTDKFCWWLVHTFPNRVKMIEVEGNPYLLRFYIKHNNRLPGIYLHRFFRGDDDRDLHNHPWRWSLSFILTGGYNEERYVGDEIVTIKKGAPGINYINGDVFHRVELLDKSGAWTLFISGPEDKHWGFRDRDTGAFIPHEAYVGG